MSQRQTDLRIYTDEDVSGRLAQALSRAGFDALSCHQAGNSGFGHLDEWQLSFAAEQRRAILTHDLGDFSKLATQWTIEGRTHYGIVLAHRAPLSNLIPRAIRYLSEVQALDLLNATRRMP